MTGKEQAAKRNTLAALEDLIVRSAKAAMQRGNQVAPFAAFVDDRNEDGFVSAVPLAPELTEHRFEVFRDVIAGLAPHTVVGFVAGFDGEFSMATEPPRRALLVVRASRLPGLTSRAHAFPYDMSTGRFGFPVVAPDGLLRPYLDLLESVT